MTDVGDLLAIDPSVRSPGAALFRDGRLVAAGRVLLAPAALTAGLNAGERCLLVGDAIVSWAHALGAHPATVAMEWPQIYAASKSKGDPNDLIAMAGVDLAVATGFALVAASEGRRMRVLTYKPAEWIGQLPKSTRGSAKSSPRAARIFSRLDASERGAVPDQHDAIDAVGIGLHALARLGVRRVLSSK